MSAADVSDYFSAAGLTDSGGNYKGRPYSIGSGSAIRYHLVDISRFRQLDGSFLNAVMLASPVN